MDEMEEKLNSILGNPQMMEQIMAMAQSMGGAPPQKSSPPPKSDASFPGLALAAIQKISALTQQSSIDKREKALLSALGAYLPRERLSKLEKAMRAAKIAKVASSALNQQGFSSSKGR